MLFLDYCADIAPIINLIKKGIIPVFQIVIPIIIILFGMIDLGKAVIASKDDEIKKAQGMLIKRIIYGVVIFLLVFLVTAVFNIFVSSTGVSEGNDWRACWDAVDK